MIRKLVAGATTVVGAGAIWAGVAGQDHSTRDTAGQIVASGQVGAFVTKVGDCFNDLPNGNFSDVLGVPCSEAHHWEEFAKESLTAINFDLPSIQSEADQICQTAVKNLASNLSQLQINQLNEAKMHIALPTEGSWSHDDRTVDCFLGSPTSNYYARMWS